MGKVSKSFEGGIGKVNIAQEGEGNSLKTTIFMEGGQFEQDEATREITIIGTWEWDLFKNAINEF